ncbi:MAG: hypothetical protein K2X32_02945 [Phycisphaerales bacterium]|nr:hypothetical protein [Phycisphaerales bacterium]
MQTVRALVLTGAVGLSASVSFGQAFINVPTTLANIEYRRDATLAPTQTWGPAAGGQWLAPNFATSGLFIDNPGLAGNTNSGFTAITYSLVNAPLPGPLTPQAVAINIPQTTFFGQSDPGNALPRASLRINFQVDYVGVAAGLGGVGYQITSLPGFYALAYNIPVGSFGQFDAQINYTSLLTNAAVLPQQNMNFGGAGVNGAGVANLAFPGAGFGYVALPGEAVRVSGFIEFQVNNGTNAVDLRVTEIPGPATAVILAVGALMRSRRR